MLFVSYSKKMDSDVLSSPASAIYRTRVVGALGAKRDRLFGMKRRLRPFFIQEQGKLDEDVSLPFVRYHSLEWH